MRPIRPALARCLLAATLLLPAAAHAAESVTAEVPPVGPFDTVEVAGHAHLVLVQGDREAVTVEASPKSRARIRVRSQGGRLIIEAGQETSWWDWLSGGSDRRPTINVHFRTLRTLRMSGAVKVTAASVDVPALRVVAAGAAAMTVESLTTKSLEFSGSGAVRAEFAGTATAQDVSISGAGVFRASKLASDTAQVRVSGAGKVVVNAQRELDARISGAGAIEYFGDPAVRQRVSGAGKIIRRSGGEPKPATMRAARADPPLSAAAACRAAACPA